jgi:hypothetical protein
MSSEGMQINIDPETETSMETRTDAEMEIETERRVINLRFDFPNLRLTVHYYRENARLLRNCSSVNKKAKTNRDSSSLNWMS